MSPVDATVIGVAPGPVPLPERLPVSAHFRYVHGSLPPAEEGIPFVGERINITALVNRILHSRGGAFLVTGFRGAGKSTVVKHALHELRERTDAKLLAVLDVARPLKPEELLFKIIRRLYDTLQDENVWWLLEPRVRDELSRSYRRTFLTLKEAQADGFENATSGSIDYTKAIPLFPAFSRSEKRTQTFTREASYLSYSHTDAEHNFVRFVERLARPVPRQLGWWKRYRLRIAANGWRGLFGLVRRCNRRRCDCVWWCCSMNSTNCDRLFARSAFRRCHCDASGARGRSRSERARYPADEREIRAWLGRGLCSRRLHRRTYTVAADQPSASSACHAGPVRR